METMHTLALVLMVTRVLIVMASISHISCPFWRFHPGFDIKTGCIMYCVLCYMFSISLEINPACSNITCHNGGSCVYINETSNAVCSCYNNFAGEFCEGITINAKMYHN